MGIRSNFYGCAASSKKTDCGNNGNRLVPDWHFVILQPDLTKCHSSLPENRFHGTTTGTGCKKRILARYAEIKNPANRPFGFHAATFPGRSARNFTWSESRKGIFPTKWLLRLVREKTQSRWKNGVEARLKNFKPWKKNFEPWNFFFGAGIFPSRPRIFPYGKPEKAKFFMIFCTKDPLCAKKSGDFPLFRSETSKVRYGKPLKKQHFAGFLTRQVALWHPCKKTFSPSHTHFSNSKT